MMKFSITGRSSQRLWGTNRGGVPAGGTRSVFRPGPNRRRDSRPSGRPKAKDQKEGPPTRQTPPRCPCSAFGGRHGRHDGRDPRYQTYAIDKYWSSFCAKCWQASCSSSPNPKTSNRLGSTLVQPIRAFPRFVQSPIYSQEFPPSSYGPPGFTA